MENPQTLDDNFESEELYLSSRVRSYLSETARWGSFLAIVSICGLVLTFVIFLLIVLFMGTTFSSELMGNDPYLTAFSGVIYFVYFLLFLIYVFPVLYLYRFSKEMKRALARNDQESLATSFENLKSLYKFFGVFTAIILGTYGLMLVGGLLFSGFF
ncbi:MAG: hypothetical protein AAGD05_14830 [Bacteroidota bacterium]